MIDLLAALRKVHPAQVRVYDAAGECRTVGVPEGRTKWKQVATTIMARPWARLDMLDRNGADIGYIENDEVSSVSTALAPLAAGAGPEASVPPWMADAILRGQELVLKHRDQEHKALLESVGTVLRANAEATRELVALFRAQRDVAADVAASNARLEAQEASKQQTGLLEELTEAAPKLLEIGRELGLLPAKN